MRAVQAQQSSTRLQTLLAESRKKILDEQSTLLAQHNDFQTLFVEQNTPVDSFHAETAGRTRQFIDVLGRRLEGGVEQKLRLEEHEHWLIELDASHQELSSRHLHLESQLETFLESERTCRKSNSCELKVLRTTLETLADELNKSLQELNQRVDGMNADNDKVKDLQTSCEELSTFRQEYSSGLKTFSSMLERVANDSKKCSTSLEELSKRVDAISAEGKGKSVTSDNRVLMEKINKLTDDGNVYSVQLTELTQRFDTEKSEYSANFTKCHASHEELASSHWDLHASCEEFVECGDREFSLKSEGQACHKFQQEGNTMTGEFADESNAGAQAPFVAAQNAERKTMYHAPHDELASSHQKPFSPHRDLQVSCEEPSERYPEGLELRAECGNQLESSLNSEGQACQKLQQEGDTMTDWELQASCEGRSKRYSEVPELRSECRDEPEFQAFNTISANLVDELHELVLRVDVQSAEQKIKQEESCALNCELSSLYKQLESSHRDFNAPQDDFEATRKSSSYELQILRTTLETSADEFSKSLQELNRRVDAMDVDHEQVKGSYRALLSSHSDLQSSCGELSTFRQEHSCGLKTFSSMLEKVANDGKKCCASLEELNQRVDGMNADHNKVKDLQTSFEELSTFRQEYSCGLKTFSSMLERVANDSKKCSTSLEELSKRVDAVSSEGKVKSVNSESRALKEKIDKLADDGKECRIQLAELTQRFDESIPSTTRITPSATVRIKSLHLHTRNFFRCSGTSKLRIKNFFQLKHARNWLAPALERRKNQLPRPEPGLLSL